MCEYIQFLRPDGIPFDGRNDPEGDWPINPANTMVTVHTDSGDSYEAEGKRCLEDKYPLLELYLVRHTCMDADGCNDNNCFGRQMEPPCIYWGITEGKTGFAILTKHQPTPVMAMAHAERIIERQGGEEATINRIKAVLKKREEAQN